MNPLSSPTNQRELRWVDAPDVESQPSASFLESALAVATESGTSASSHRGAAEHQQLADFLAAQTPSEIFDRWFGEDCRAANGHLPWRDFALRLQAAIAKIDQGIQSLLNAILHHPDFQRLEASWRGIAYLVECKDRSSGDAPVRIRVLNAKWSELARDFDRALEFDQSQLFKKVYEEGIGTPGADPFSALIVDQAVDLRSSQERSAEDLAVVNGIAQVAAAAFAPAILNAAPSMLRVDRFDELHAALNWDSFHDSKEYFDWNNLRQIEDSRFIALALPQMLMRRPYHDRPSLIKGFPFEEEIVTRDDYLWGGAAFAMGEVLIRSFRNNGWLADIRGVQRNTDRGGLVLGPAIDEFQTDSPGVAIKPLTDLVVDDVLERALSRLGFLPLCQCKEMPSAAFYSCPSIQRPKKYDKADAQLNAKLSSMLNYILCASRFAHYTKVIVRDILGSLVGPEEIERRLQDWIVDYVNRDPDADVDSRSRRPLQAAEIRVRPIPGRPGEYDSILHLSPNHELDDVQASIRLDTRLAPRRT